VEKLANVVTTSHMMAAIPENEHLPFYNMVTSAIFKCLSVLN